MRQSPLFRPLLMVLALILVALSYRAMVSQLVESSLTEIRQPEFRNSLERTEAEQQRQIARDLKVLRTESENEVDRALALLRLAKIQREEARDFAELFLSVGPEGLKDEAIEALGFYQDSEAERLLSENLRSGDSEIRRAALRGLGHASGVERGQTLKDLLRATDNEDKVAVLLGLCEWGKRNKNGASEKISALTQLQKMTRKRDIARSAAQALLECDSQDQSVVLWLRAQYLSPSPSLSRERIIELLAEMTDPWLKNQFSEFYAAASIESKKTLIKAIARFCPQNRWKLIEEAALDGAHVDLAIEAIRSILTMPGRQADELLLRLDQSVLLPPVKERLLDTEALMGEIKKTDPCQTLSQNQGQSGNFRK